MSKSFKAALAAILLAGSATFVVAQSANQAPDNGQSPMPSEEQMAGQGYGGGGWWGFGGHHGRGHGDGHGMRGDWGGGKRGPGMRMMQMIDQNGDGSISEDEAAGLADHMYQRLDQNNDGSLDKAEFATPRKGRGGMRGWFGWSSEEAAAVQKVREDKFVTLDTDKDGKLTKAEFFVDAKAKLAAADTDKDGKVSPWEFRSQN